MFLFSFEDLSFLMMSQIKHLKDFVAVEYLSKICSFFDIQKIFIEHLLGVK